MMRKVGGALRRPKVAIPVALGVLLVGGGAAMAVFGMPDVVDDLRASVGAPVSLKDLVQKAKEDPKDASVQRMLGDAQFEAGNRNAGLRAYERALKLERDSETEKMLENMVSCYGRGEQSLAHALIVQHKLVNAEKGLEELTRSKSWRVRTGAINTLEKIGKASKADYLRVWIADLEHSDCEVRQHAVEKLGELGDKRALDDIRAAKKKEDDTTPWFQGKCLGSRIEDAEKKILAAR